MRSLLPYPLLALGLSIMWLLLAGITPGQFVLAVVMSIAASHALKALGEASPRIRRWLAPPKLLAIVLYDIVRSNIAVTRILLSATSQPRVAGFLVFPTRLRHPYALAILSIVITSTPGTAWVDYNSARGEIIIHIFDLVDRSAWIDLFADRYESLLLEMFE